MSGRTKYDKIQIFATTQPRNPTASRYRPAWIVVDSIGDFTDRIQLIIVESSLFPRQIAFSGVVLRRFVNFRDGERERVRDGQDSSIQGCATR